MGIGAEDQIVLDSLVGKNQTSFRHHDEAARDHGVGRSSRNVLTLEQNATCCWPDKAC